MELLVALPPLEDYSPDTGGAVTTVVEALARHWAGYGVGVTVIGPPGQNRYNTGSFYPLSYRWPEPKLGRRLLAGIGRRVHDYDWPGYPIYLRDVRRALAEISPDWLLVHNDAVLPAVVHRQTSPKTRIGLTLHNTVNTRRPARAGAGLRRVALRTAVSSFIAREAENAFGLGSGDIAVVNNGVDNAFFVGPARANAERPLKVAFAGRLLFDKGPHLLLEAAAILAERGVKLDLTVAGSPTFRREAHHTADPYVKSTTAQVRRLGGRYFEHLNRQGVADLLREQDVLIVPSLFNDPFPLTVFEGMASGCAVITSDRGGLPEAGGDAAMVFPSGNVTALADALHRLHLNRNELLWRKERSLERAAANDWQVVAQRWLRLLELVEPPPS